MDWSNLKFVKQDSNQYSFQGHVTFLIDINRLQGRYMYQKLVRGEWVMKGFDGTYADFCVSFHDPIHPFYTQMNHLPKCPMKAGVRLKSSLILKKIRK